MKQIMGDSEKAAKLGALGELKGFLKEMLTGHMGSKKPKAVSVEVETLSPKSEDGPDEEVSSDDMEKLMDMCK